ncbi:ACP S-malonyltransferase [Lachnospiraceae bacterium 48-21]
MSKIAFIYPGQGAQKAGMGADFYEKSETAKSIFVEAGRMLGLDMKALCFEENEKLDLTEYTQAALVTTCLAMTRVVKERGLRPDMTAGLSLGEYCAIAAAGGMDDMDAIRLVRKRGILMQNTVPAGEGGMCAVMGLDSVKIEETLAKMQEGRNPGDVTIANYNCPGQIVITGKTAAVKDASVKLKEAGAKRVMMLNVSGPFHSPLLVPAGEELAAELEAVTLHPLQIPYVTNVTAEKVEDIAKTKGLLKEQVSSSVRWMQSMEYMIREGVDTFVEIGPGKTLAGFMKKIERDVKVYNIASWDDVEKTISGLCESQTKD